MSELKTIISNNILPVELRDIPSIMKGEQGERGRDGSYTQKAYKTYASMLADKASIPANTNVVVNNDPDKSKNAFYTYDGTTFTKGDFDPQVVLETIDNRLDLAVESASEYFQSQVATTVDTAIGNSTIAYNQAIEVTKGQWANTISITNDNIKANSEVYLATLPGIVNNAINNTAVDGGILADTFVTATANGVGKVPRTQRDVNSEYTTIADFGGNLTAAGNWIKQSTSNYCYLEAGKTYTYTGTGEVYFNRFICRDGQATVVIPKGITLLYCNEALGKPDVVHIENVKYIVHGHRIDKNVTDTSADYLYAGRLMTNAIKSLFLKNIVVLALANPNDENSWEDNINESRMDNFISYSIIESSHLENITMYGVAMLGNIATVNPNAVHTELNIKMYNAETGIYLMPASGNYSVGKWSIGLSKSIYIINKPENQSYWLRKGLGILTNGKDCIMCEADHSIRYDIDTVVGIYPLERSAYIMSTNSYIKNSYDIGGSNGIGVKRGFIVVPNSKAYLSNGVIRNITDITSTLPAYGFDFLSIDNMHIDSLGWCVVTSSMGELRISNLDITRAATAVLAYGADSRYGQNNNNGEFNIRKIEFRDTILRNIGGSDVPSIYYAVHDIVVNEVHLTNIKVKEDNVRRMHFSTPIDASRTKRMYINNVEGYGRTGVVTKDSTTEYINIQDSRFNIIDPDGTGTNYVQFAESYNSQANVFDFTTTFLSKLPTLKSGHMKIHHKKDIDTGFVKVLDHWKSVEIVLETYHTPSYLTLFKSPGYSFEFEMYFQGEMVKGVYNHIANSTTATISSGGVLSIGSDGVDKIRLYFDQGNWIISIGNSTGWTGGLHPLKIIIKRM